MLHEADELPGREAVGRRTEHGVAVMSHSHSQHLDSAEPRNSTCVCWLGHVL